MSESAAERQLHARAASLANWARVPDRAAAMAPLRDGFRRKLEREIDPDGVLDPVELARRVDMARRAHLANASRIAAKKARERREAASQ
jgi:hypothetical protein